MRRAGGLITGGRYINIDLKGHMVEPGPAQPPRRPAPARGLGGSRPHLHNAGGFSFVRHSLHSREIVGISMWCSTTCHADGLRSLASPRSTSREGFLSCPPSLAFTHSHSTLDPTARSHQRTLISNDRRASQCAHPHSCALPATLSRQCWLAC